MSTGRVFKRGRLWWVQYSVGGRQYRESAKTTRKEEAHALLRKRMQGIWEGTFFPEAKRTRARRTVGELRDEWLKAKKGKLSIKSDEYRFAAFVAHVGEHRQLATIDGDAVREFFASLGEHEPSTRNRYRALLHSAFKLATRLGYAHRDPIVGVDLEPERNERNRICSPEEYAQLREHADPDLRAFITVGYWIGMREGEIAKLDTGRLSIKARELRLRGADTKEGSAKTLPIPSDVIAEIEQLPRRISGKLFAWSAATYSRKFKALCGELGIKDLHFHDLRHTALTRMGEAGLSVHEIAAISGHKTLRMLQRYVHTGPAQLKSAMARVEAHAAGRPRS